MDQHETQVVGGVRERNDEKGALYFKNSAGFINIKRFLGRVVVLGCYQK